MSFSSSSQRIDPFGLLSDSLSQVAPIYLPLLILNSPLTIISILQQLLAPTKIQAAAERATQVSPLYTIVTLVGGLVVTPIVAGTIISFVYRYITQGTQDLSGAFNQGLNKSFQFILGSIVYVLIVGVGLICLIAPGIYLAVLLGFFPYGMITENYSLIESFKSSVRLVKGRWWRVFGSMLLILLFAFAFYVAMFVVGAFLGIVLGLLKVNIGTIMLISTIIGGIIGILLTPPLNLYYVKLYLRLQEIAGLS